LLLADHDAPVRYEIPLPTYGHSASRPKATSLYVHAPRGRKGRATDASTERFVEATRMGAAP
jgi:hypothetical protein